MGSLTVKGGDGWHVEARKLIAIRSVSGGHVQPQFDQIGVCYGMSGDETVGVLPASTSSARRVSHSASQAGSFSAGMGRAMK